MTDSVLHKQNATQFKLKNAHALLLADEYN